MSGYSTIVQFQNGTTDNFCALHHLVRNGFKIGDGAKIIIEFESEPKVNINL